MAIELFDKDVEIIQKLDDEPNDVQGLTPAELKKRFDQAAVWLKEYINSTLIPAITGDGVSGGAANIGASVDDFSGSTVQDVLDAFNDALVARYTKSETNVYVSQETSDLVASVSVNLNTGVITVTKKDGTQDTFDTALEKVPASMALVEEADGTYLVITNQDGSQTRTNVSNLIDTYTFNNSTEISFSVAGAENNKAVTASIRDSSIGMNKFTLEVTQALEQYNADSAANAQSAGDSAEAAAESASEALASRNEAADSASTAATKAGEASRSAGSASQSAGSAASSAQSAQSNASQALSARNAAQQAQKSIENMQVSANTLPAGTEATVTKTVEDGTVKLNFGLPQGADGGAIAADGLWGVRVDENGDLILTYVGDDIPPLSINEDGNLIYTLSGNQIIIGNVGTGGGGSGGTMNYELLLNKPSINGIPLQGNLTTEELGIRDGQDGAPGADGAPGKAATIRVGSVTSGDTLSVTNSGTETDAVLDFVLKPGPQGPAGEGVPPTDTAKKGDVPTFDGQSVVWAAPTGGSEREWTMLGETDCSVVSGNIIYDGLENFTEFLVLAETVKNNSPTNSGYGLFVNGTWIAQNPISVRNQSLSTEYYQWMYAKFDGIVWDVRSTSGATAETNLAINSGNAQYPYNFVLDVGAATEFKLQAPVPQYQAVSGKITVWGR